MVNHHFWLPFALVRVVIFYVIGVLLAVFDVIDLSRVTSLYLSLLFTSLYLAGWLILKRGLFSRFNSLFAFIGFFALILLGYSNLKWKNESLNDDHIINNSGINAYKAIVDDNGYETDKTIRYKLNINALYDSVWKSSCGRIYLYVSKLDSFRYNYGDEIIVKGRPNKLQKPKNPGEFDYKRFLSFNNIYHQHYSVGNNIAKVGENNGSHLLDLAYQARVYAVKVLTEKITTERERNIALALVLGNKDGLTDEIKNAYSASGAMHVLAVSGLHVGIIYSIILLLFGRIDKSTSGRWGLAVISLVSLWTYAAVTGFSPSVLRAVTMFSFVAVAKASLNTTNIYNTLAASAFVLLLWDPYLIMSVGFQLSYLAVLGIVYVQPRVYKLYISKYYLVDKIWQITSVSIAAQISTFALGLLYFHQFPSFFLLSNLIVIPGAFLILLGGILAIGTSFFEPLSNVIGEILKWLIYIVNEVVFWIEGLPFSLIQGVYITIFDTWMIMLSIVFVFLLIQFRSMKYIYLSVICAILFTVSQWQGIVESRSQKQLTIHRVNNHLSLNFNANGKTTIYSDSVLLEDEDKMRFHLRPNQLRTALVKSDQVYRSIANNGIEVIKWENKKIIILSKPINFDPGLMSLDCNLLILSDKFEGSIDDLTRCFIFDQLIIDGSLKGWVANKLLTEGEFKKLNIYSVYHNGALQLKI